MKNALNWILKKIGSIPHDKLLHLFFGLLIFDFTYPFLGNLVALGIVFMLGIFKEIIDREIGGSVDWKDSACTIIGGILGLLHTLL